MAIAGIADVGTFSVNGPPIFRLKSIAFVDSDSIMVAESANNGSCHLNTHILSVGEPSVWDDLYKLLHKLREGTTVVFASVGDAMRGLTPEIRNHLQVRIVILLLSDPTEWWRVARLKVN